MSARHTLPFVCFACRKSFKIDIEANDDSDLAELRVTRPCPQCAGAMPFAGRYFKAPPQDDEKQWVKTRLLWEEGWFNSPSGRGAPKSLCDAQTALLFAERQRKIEESRQRRGESETKWRRASRRRRDF